VCLSVFIRGLSNWLVVCGLVVESSHLSLFHLDLDERILKQQQEEEERKRQRREKKKEKKVRLYYHALLIANIRES
jgi:hypothetical protein